MKQPSRKLKRLAWGGMGVSALLAVLLLAFPPIAGTWRLHFTDRIGQRNEVLFRDGAATVVDRDSGIEVFGSYRRETLGKFGWYRDGHRIGSLILYSPFYMRIRGEILCRDGKYSIDDGGSFFSGYGGWKCFNAKQQSPTSSKRQNEIEAQQ